MKNLNDLDLEAEDVLSSVPSQLSVNLKDAIEKVCIP